jgi:hypothetical protein
MRLKQFLEEIVQHFSNRASQRERMSLRTYDTYKGNDSSEMRESIPETFGVNRSLLPDETFVLIAFYKNVTHLKWIIKRKLYNARTGQSKGSLRLNSKLTGARYLLLHGEEELHTGKLYKLKSEGPRIFSKDQMLEMEYPEPSQNFYLLFDISGEGEREFKKYVWDVSSLKGYKKGRGSALPFAVTIAELMKAKIHQ